MHSAEESVFIAREYWRMGSFKQCQRSFLNKYGEGSVPPKSCIHKLVKGRVYNNKAPTIDALKDVVRRDVAAITDVTLPDVFANLQARIQKCLEAGGGQFQHML
jgi:hypothetical protein